MTNTFKSPGVFTECAIGTSVCNQSGTHITILQDPAWSTDFGRGDIVQEYVIPGVVSPTNPNAGQTSYQPWDGTSVPLLLAASVFSTMQEPLTTNIKRDTYAPGSSYPVSQMTPSMQAIVQANYPVLVANGWTVELAGTTVVSVTSA